MSNELTPYHELRSKMKTGDLIAFADDSAISKVIRRVTSGEFSHVGMVLRLDIAGFGDSVFLLESSASVNMPDAVTGEFTRGVQLHLLSERLGRHDGRAAWVPLTTGIDSRPTDSMLSWLRDMHKKRVSYDLAQAMGSGLKFWQSLLPNEADYSKLFCSEMCARALQIAGKVLTSINPSMETPQQVLTYSCFLLPVPIKNP